MKKDELIETKWAQEFLFYDDTCFDKAIEIALSNIEYNVYLTDEVVDPLWVIDHNGFWMDGKSSLEEAVKLCEDMGWKYKVINK